MFRSNLSSGQLQLLAIARSLLHKSRILILDEGMTPQLYIVEKLEH